jgi:hypothetical protein
VNDQIPQLGPETGIVGAAEAIIAADQAPIGLPDRCSGYAADPTIQHLADCRVCLPDDATGDIVALVIEAPKLHVNRFASRAIAARAIRPDTDEQPGAWASDVQSNYLDLRYAELLKERAKVAMKAVTADLRAQGLMAEPRGTNEWARFDEASFRVKNLYTYLMDLTVEAAGDLEPIRVWAEANRAERRADKVAAAFALADDDGSDGDVALNAGFGD